MCKLSNNSLKPSFKNFSGSAPLIAVWILEKNIYCILFTFKSLSKYILFTIKIIRYQVLVCMHPKGDDLYNYKMKIKDLIFCESLNEDGGIGIYPNFANEQLPIISTACYM